MTDALVEPTQAVDLHYRFSVEKFKFKLSLLYIGKTDRKNYVFIYSKEHSGNFKPELTEAADSAYCY